MSYAELLSAKDEIATRYCEPNEVRHASRMLRTMGFQGPHAVVSYQRSVFPRAGRVDGLLGPSTYSALQRDFLFLKRKGDGR